MSSDCDTALVIPVSQPVVIEVGIPGPPGAPGVPGPPGGAPWVEDEFTTTAGQVTFILSQAPTDASSLTFHVNGVLYDDVADFTVSGTTITWTNVPFVMGIGDKVHIRYV